MFCIRKPYSVLYEPQVLFTREAIKGLRTISFGFVCSNMKAQSDVAVKIKFAISLIVAVPNIVTEILNLS